MIKADAKVLIIIIVERIVVFIANFLICQISYIPSLYIYKFVDIFFVANAIACTSSYHFRVVWRGPRKTGQSEVSLTF